MKKRPGALRLRSIALASFGLTGGLASGAYHVAHGAAYWALLDGITVGVAGSVLLRWWDEGRSL